MHLTIGVNNIHTNSEGDSLCRIQNSLASTKLPNWLALVHRLSQTGAPGMLISRSQSQISNLGQYFAQVPFAPGSTGAPPREDKNSLAAEKLAQDLLDFLKNATGAPWKPKI